MKKGGILNLKLTYLKTLEKTKTDNGVLLILTKNSLIRALAHLIVHEEVYLVTALVPSETACLANSPGRSSLTAVWISREVMVDLLL